MDWTPGDIESDGKSYDDQSGFAVSPAGRHQAIWQSTFSEMRHASAVHYNTEPRELLLAGIARIVDAKSGEELFQVPAQKQNAEVDRSPFCFSADGRLLFVIAGRHIEAWNVETQQRVGRLVGHFDMVTCLAGSRTENRIFSGSADRTIKMWDTSDLLSSSTGKLAP